MFITYFRVVKSRKFIRFVFTVFKLFIIILVLALIWLILYLDLGCVPKIYKPNVKLKSKLNGYHQMRDKTFDPKWTPIVDNVVSIYSSFKIHHQVRIIAIMDKYSLSRDFICEMKQNSLILRVKADVKILSESWERYYRFVSVSITCLTNTTSLWSKVKLIFSVDNILLETSYIPIEEPTRTRDLNIRSLVVCVRPLFGHFISSAQILEFLAYYKANRIDSIIFYDLDISAQIRQLLLNIPFVQLLSFSLPIDSSDIHANGQIAALNDCVMRSANSFVIHVDIDELIVTSNKFANIKDLVETKAQNQTIGALIIPNVMICDEFNFDKSFPRIISETMRQTSEWEHNDRSKAIIFKPLSVRRLGIHTVWEWKDSSGSDLIEQIDASLFHFRSCCRVWQPSNKFHFYGFKSYFLSYKDSVVQDLSVRRFKNNITSFLKKYLELDNS